MIDLEFWILQINKGSISSHLTLTHVSAHAHQLWRALVENEEIHHHGIISRSESGPVMSALLYSNNLFRQTKQAYPPLVKDEVIYY